MSDSSNRKIAPGALAAAVAALAASDYTPAVPDLLSGYGIAGALQAAPIDNLFGIARGLTPAVTHVDVIELDDDATVLQALAEVEADNHQRLVAEAYAERLSGKHTLH